MDAIQVPVISTLQFISHRSSFWCVYINKMRHLTDTLSNPLPLKLWSILKFWVAKVKAEIYIVQQCQLFLLMAHIVANSNRFHHTKNYCEYTVNMLAVQTIYSVSKHTLVDFTFVISISLFTCPRLEYWLGWMTTIHFSNPQVIGQDVALYSVLNLMIV